jgi:ligand-binding SRPBCC domain-containing protein
VWDPPNRFVDEQVVGPYRSWHHLHEFRAMEAGTEIRDTVHYALPLGPLGRLAHLLAVRRQLESIFAFRERVIAELFGGTDGRLVKREG